jgi:AcrR family transcriptional regulator
MVVANNVSQEVDVPPEASSRRAEIVGAALALLEEHGPEAVTMRAIAERLGIRAPSLYKHFPDKDAVEVALVAEGLRDSARHFRRAVRGSSDPLRDLALAYRRWAVRRPHLYRLMTHKPLPRERLPAGVEAAAAAPVVTAVGGDRDLARATWAFAHGMASLEIAGRFPADADLDAAWEAGTSALHEHVHTDEEEDRS